MTKDAAKKKSLQGNRQWAPRLSIEITPAQDSSLRRLLVWGEKGAIFRAMIDSLIRLLERDPIGTISQIKYKLVGAKEFLQLDEHVDDPRLWLNNLVKEYEIEVGDGIAERFQDWIIKRSRKENDKD